MPAPAGRRPHASGTCRSTRTPARRTSSTSHPPRAADRRVALLDALEHAREHLGDRFDHRGLQLVPGVLVAERDRRLGEDPARIELGVHVVEREAELGLAVPDRPRDRARAAIARKERRVPVHDPVPRHGQGSGGNLPRKARAEREVRLVHAEQRRDLGTRRGHDDVELRGRLREDLVELPVALRALAGAEKRHGLVPEPVQERAVAEDRRQDLRDEHDPHDELSRARSTACAPSPSRACRRAPARCARSSGSGRRPGRRTPSARPSPPRAR